MGGLAYRLVGDPVLPES